MESKRQDGATIFISHKEHFQLKLVWREKKSQILIMGRIYEEE
jgi:hypothetical protein